MTSILVADKKEYHVKWTQILKEEPTVKFARLINKSGEMTSGRHKQVEAYLSEKQKKEIFKEVAIRVNKRK